MKNLPEFDYLKELENNVETSIGPDQYMIARLDGNNFHTFTKGLKRPFDATLRETMADVTRKLMTEFGATEAFTQSDEITLIWKPRMNRSGTAMVEHPRSGRVLKMSTLMASYCSIEFYKLIHKYHDNTYNGFDCRIYAGDETVARDSLRFRFIDAAANAYQSVAQSLWSPKKLHGMSVQNIKTALTEEMGINVWQAYGEDAMLGVYFYKEEVVAHSSPMTLWNNEVVMVNRTGRHRIVRATGADMMKRMKDENGLQTGN